MRLTAHDRVGELRAQRLALLRFRLLEERGQHQIAVDAGRVQLVAGVAPPQTPFLVGHLLTGLADAFAERRDLRQVLADPHDLEAGLELRRVPFPVKRLDLPPRQADQRVAVPQGVVQKGERVILRQGDEPLVLVGGNLRHRVVPAPRFDQCVGELPARFDQEGARAHRRVADLEVEDPFVVRRSPLLRAQPAEDRLQRLAHDRLRQLTGRVVRAGTPTLLARLQHHGAAGHEVRRRIVVDHGIEGGVQRLGGGRIPHGPPHPIRQLAVGAVLNPPGAAGRRFAQQRLDVHRSRRAVFLGGPDRGGAARRGLQSKPHHGLVDGTDMLDVQGAVGDALAVEDEELLQHPVDGAVGHQWRFDPFADRPAGGLDHVRHAKIEPARAFAARRREQA